MSENPLLLVPTEVDVLYVEAGLSVADGFRFNELPYPGSVRDMNPDTVNISESIANKAFQNKNLFLKQGLHFHWFLPDFFMRGEQVAGNQMRYAPAPNVWLVIRKKAADTKKWIVESDYLHDPKTGYQEDSVILGCQYPYINDADKQASPQCCFVGRQLDFDDWDKNRAGAGNKYLKDSKDGGGNPQPLTVLSGGCFEFSLFYPYCRSIFGFYDKDGIPDDDAQYCILGWHKDSGTVGEFIAQGQGDSADRISKEVLMSEFGFALEQGVSEIPGSSQLACFAKVGFGANNNKTITQKSADVKLAVANSEQEALCAYITDRLTDDVTYKNYKDNKDVVEQQLNLFVHSNELENYNLDKYLKYQIIRHANSFDSVVYGSSWKISEKELQEGEELVLPEDVIDGLRELNAEQIKYQKLARNLKSMRHQLFITWYKYMLCCYPPEDSPDVYPDIDLVKNHIEDVFLAEIEKKEVQLADLEQRVVQCKGKVSSLLSEGLELAEVPNPRYFEPKEPTLLLVEEKTSTSKSLEPITNCEKFGAVEGGLPVKFINQDFNNYLNAPNNIVTEIEKILAEDRFKKKESNQIYGLTTWNKQPWKPFLLAWLLEIFPPLEGNNKRSENHDFSEDYIRTNYTIEEQAYDLSPKTRYKVNQTFRKGLVVDEDSNIYAGFSFLTNTANSALSDAIKAAEDILKDSGTENITHPLYTKVEEYIKKRKKRQGFRDYQLENYIRHYLPRSFFQKYNSATYSYGRIEENETGIKYLSRKDKFDYFQDLKSLEAIQNWFEESGRNKIRAIKKILNQAKTELDKVECLSQKIGGFNEALLMRKQTMQLKINDPIGFDEYKRFTDLVSAAVLDNTKSAPQPLNDFTPIRAGKINMIDLELIDTFGQIRKIRWQENLIAPGFMTGKDNAVYLPPRVVQPLRVNFRFLDSNQNKWKAEGEAYHACYDQSTTPICGWILPNNLDKGLDIYDNEGKLLGFINPNYGWDTGFAEGMTGIQDGAADNISNTHLKKIVDQILGMKGKDQPFLQNFIDVLNNSLENISPDEYKESGNLAVLFTRPIALVRVSVDLQIRGQPAVNQDWQAFEQELQQGIPFEDLKRDKFPQVKFPIRVGNYEQQSDGIIGYFKEMKGGTVEGYQYEGDKFFAQQSDSVESTYIETQFWNPDNGQEEGPINIAQSIADEPQKLTILMDPANTIHISCGVLPTKDISIPKRLYQTVLNRMQILFLTTPILLRDEKRYQMPLPHFPGTSFDLLVPKSAGGLEQTDATPIIKKTDLLASLPAKISDKEACIAQLVAKKWLEVLETDVNYKVLALLKGKNGDRQALDDKYWLYKEDIKAVLQNFSGYLSDLDEKSFHFTESSKIIEGWLRVKDKSQ